MAVPTAPAASLLLIAALFLAGLGAATMLPAAEPQEANTPPPPETRPARTALYIADAMLAALDVEARTITVTMGRDADPGAAKLVLPVPRETGITISFFQSPSIANSVPQELGALKVGMPVSFDLSVSGDRIVISRLVGWRDKGEHRPLER